MTSAESTTPVPASLLSVHRWPRRRQVIGAVTAIAVVAALTLWIRGGGGPEAVVRSYLEAIRAGDVAEALRVAGDPDPASEQTGVQADRDFLVAGALSADWDIEQVVRRYPGEDAQPVVVDVTLSAPDGTTGQGRFQLSERDGDWSIDEPFGALQIWQPPPADFVEINGMVREPERPLITEPSTYFQLFPGVYRVFSSLAGLIAIERHTVVVLPGTAPAVFAPPLELTAAGQAAAQHAVEAYVDDCAARASPNPSGCPFSAAEGLLPLVEVQDGYYEDAENIAWEVVSYPDVKVVPTEYGLGGVDRHAGSVRVTGTGVPLGEDERRSFDAECRIELGHLRLTMTSSGDFLVSGEDASSSSCA